MFEKHECPTGAKLRKGSIFTMNFPLSTCNHYSKIGDYQTDNSNFDQTMLQWWPVLCLWPWDPIISSLKSTSVASLVTTPKSRNILSRKHFGWWHAIDLDLWHWDQKINRTYFFSRDIHSNLPSSATFN